MNPGDNPDAEGSQMGPKLMFDRLVLSLEASSVLEFSLSRFLGRGCDRSTFQ